MNKPVKFAVVGCGHIGRRHAEIIMQNSEAELVALIDVKPKSILEIPQFNDVPFFESLDEFAASSTDVDVINITTPNGYHAQQALECLDIPTHIVIEKPMALKKADAEKIIAKALQANKHVFTIMQNRYSLPSVWVKEIIDSKKLGSIFMVQVNCYWNRDERYYSADSWHGKKNLDGGTLFTQFAHFIDMIYWLFGDIKNITCRFNNYSHQTLTEFEDSGIVSFDFVNSGMGSINFSTAVWNKNFESSITIIAENGSIKIGGQYMDQVEYCNIKNYTMPQLGDTDGDNKFNTDKESAQNHNYIIKNVINVIKGKEDIITKASEGLKVVEIIEKIYECSR